MGGAPGVNQGGMLNEAGMGIMSSIPECPGSLVGGWMGGGWMDGWWVDGWVVSGCMDEGWCVGGWIVEV